MKEQRLFIGNLPNNVSESELKKLLGNYGVSKIEIKKKQTLGQETVFAFVNISSNQLNDCLTNVNNKKWKNCNLKVQIAKESFLDKLKKEHQDKDQQNHAKVKTVGNYELNINRNGVKNKRIVFNEDDEPTAPFSSSVSKEISSVEFPSSEKTPEEIPRKRNLPMFRGTTTVSLTNPEPRNNIQSNVDVRDIANHACSAMERFEAFSDVWKDCDDNYQPNFKIKRNSSDFRENKNLKWKSKFPNDNSFESNKSFNAEFGMKSNFDELKRKTPVKKFSYNEGIHKNVERSEDDNSIDFEIVARTDDSKARKVNWKSNTQNIDQSEQEIYPLEKDINIKPGIVQKGTKEKKLLWKSKILNTNQSEYRFLTSEENPTTEPVTVQRETTEKKMLWKSKIVVDEDERFQLSDKFFEEDNDTFYEKPNKKKMVECLSEQDLPDDSTAKEVFQHRQLVRYDPTRPDHKILEKKNQNFLNKKKQPPKQTKQDINTSQETKKSKNKLDKSEQKEKSEPPKPIVSKEKHYSVADTLKNTFKKTEDHSEFRLSALFDEKLKEDHEVTDEEENQQEITLKSDFEKSVVNDSVSEEELENNEPVNFPSFAPEKILGKCGVWGETFFFQPDDTRFEEAKEFYSQDNKKAVDFGRRRLALRSIIRKKLQNTRRDNKLFKQKLGGKINKSKFKMRLKNARSY